MSQLTFDGFVEKSDAAEPAAVAAAERKESWYKGRVLSHSSVLLYRTCPQKWKFRYIDKIPEKPRSFFSFGKSVHAGLEFLFTKLEDGFPPLDDVIAHYHANWLRDGYESAVQEKWFFQEGERILRGFHAKHQRELARVLKVEFKFMVDIEGVPVTGFIDRIDSTERGGLAIVDYKTGKAFDKSRVRKDPQLTLYQMAASQLLGKPVESVTLYHLNSLTPLTVPAHPHVLEDELRAVVVESAKGISEGRFDPKPDEKGHCQWCDYAQVCPAFSGRKAVHTPGADTIGAIADRYGKIDKKVQDLLAERQQLGDAIRLHLQQSGRTELAGREFRVKLVPPANGEEPGLDASPLKG